MELRHEFTVPVETGEAWSLLTNLERVAPCMPGATLLEHENGVYVGEVKVKVGPITSRYRGEATFIEQDMESLRAVLRADGRDVKGQGNASAVVSASLIPDGGRTRVTVETELNITGRAAQFGRGILAEVSERLMDEFARTLEAELSGDGAADSAGVDEPTGGHIGPGSMNVHSPAATEELDLLRTAGVPLLRRLVPALLSTLVVWLVVRRMRRARPARHRRAA